MLDGITQAITAQEAAVKAAEEGSKYKITSIPSDFSFNNVYRAGPDRSDIMYFSTNVNGNDYYFVPSDVLQQGAVIGLGGNAWGAPSTYYYPKALSDSFQSQIKNSGTYADLADIPFPGGDGTFGDHFQRAGRSSKGFFIPINETTTSILQDPAVGGVGPNNTSSIAGVINVPDKGLSYRMVNSLGHELSYITSEGQQYVWDKPSQSALQKFMSNLGPLPALATAIFAPEFLPLVTGAQTAIQGGDLGDILKSAGTSYVLSQVGQAAAGLGDEAAASAQYGTDLGSQQTAMLAAQEAGMGSAADVAGNVLGKTATSAVSSALTGAKSDPVAMLASMGASTVAPMLTEQIEGFTDLPVRAQNAINTIVASEMAGKDPTNAVIAEAMRAGKDAYNNESNAIKAGWDSYSQLQDAASLGIGTKDAYLAYQQGAPANDGTTAGIQEVIDQIQTTPKDDGTTSDIQKVIDEIQQKPTTTEDLQNIINPPVSVDTETSNLPSPDSGSLGSESDLPPTDQGGSLGNESDLPPTDQGGSLGDESDLPPYQGGSLGDESDLPPDQGGSLGDESDMPPAEEPQCAAGYHWDGSMCVSDEDVTDTSTSCPDGYIFDLTTHSCVPIGETSTEDSSGKTGSGGATIGGNKPGTTPTPTTPKTPTTPTGTPTGTPSGTPTPTSTTDSTGSDINKLLAYLAMNQRQQPQPTPLADIKYYYDFGDDLLPTKPENNQSKNPTFGFFDGGEVDDVSVDDLIKMLQGD